MRRILPALGLFLLAPLIGEFLLGNLPITSLWLLLFIAPLYGCGAVLIRETARCYGLGWSSMIVMGLAYAIVEEAFVTQSLFNPNFLGLRLLDYGFIPQFGISAWWTVYVLIIYTIWSIAVPIALVESLTTRRRTPWLGKVGFAGIVMLFVIVCIVSFVASATSFRASNVQFLVSALAVVGLILIAFMFDRRKSTMHRTTEIPKTKIPKVPLVAGIAFLLGSAFMVLAAIVQSSLPASVVVSGMILLLIVGSVLLWQGSQHPNWNEQHTFAVAGGLLLVYAWFGFVQQPSISASPTLDILGNSIFAGGAVVLLIIAWKRFDVERSLDAN